MKRKSCAADLFEECGCLFKLTRKDSHLIKLLDGDLSTSCPECKNRVNVSKPLVDYIYQLTTLSSAPLREAFFNFLQKPKKDRIKILRIQLLSFTPLFSRKRAKGGGLFFKLLSLRNFYPKAQSARISDKITATQMPIKALAWVLFLADNLPKICNSIVKFCGKGLVCPANHKYMHTIPSIKVCQQAILIILNIGHSQ